MKKIKKRTRKNQNTLEQYAARSIGDCVCSCYCGPGGYPWAQARDEQEIGFFKQP